MCRNCLGVLHELTHLILPFNKAWALKPDDRAFPSALLLSRSVTLLKLIKQPKASICSLEKGVIRAPALKNC